MSDVREPFPKKTTVRAVDQWLRRSGATCIFCGDPADENLAFLPAPACQDCGDLVKYRRVDDVLTVLLLCIAARGGIEPAPAREHDE